MPFTPFNRQLSGSDKLMTIKQKTETDRCIKETKKSISTFSSRNRDVSTKRSTDCVETSDFFSIPCIAKMQEAMY